jgi:imidazolonepropionase-like amidohydrolase
MTPSPRAAFAVGAARVFTGDDLLGPAFLVVEDGRIAAIEKQRPDSVGEIIELDDATILPGLVDAHTHVSIVPGDGDQIGQLRLPAEVQLAAARRNVARDLASGVTTMRVMGQELDVDFRLKDEIERDLTAGPALVCAGVQIAREGQHGHAITGVRLVEDIQRIARQNLAKGAGVIKIFATGGVSTSGTAQDACPFSIDEIRAAADVAHAGGVKLAAHAHGGEGARRAIEGGVDTIEHGASLDASLIHTMLERGRAVVGTFSILFHPDGIERGDGGNAAIMAKVRAARGTVADSWRAIVAAGVRVALGTDSMHGCLPFDVAKLVEFGARPLDALRAATAVGADVCDLPDRGRLAPGLRADLLAVRGNPLLDIGSLDHPLLVVRGGRMVAPARAPARRPS